MITAEQARAEMVDRATVVQAAVANLLTQLQPQVCAQAAAGFGHIVLPVQTEADVLFALSATLTALGYSVAGDAANFSLSWA